MTDINITRRAVFGGMAAISAIGSAGATLAVLPAPITQKDIAQRVRALSDEMSRLLDHLDNGQWWVRVSPTFNGLSNYHIEPVTLSARLRLYRALSMAAAALDELCPADWHTHCDLELVLVSITRGGSATNL
jgi:hypothetical protein